MRTQVFTFDCPVSARCRKTFTIVLQGESTDRPEVGMFIDRILQHAVDHHAKRLASWMHYTPSVN